MPQLSLPEFFHLAADLGFEYVELRNDLAGKEILDGLPDDALRELLNATGIEPLTINALYPFEDVQSLDTNLLKLNGLIAEAKRISCSQIVLCPFNDVTDPRSPAQRADQLVTALNAFGPLFAEAKMTGLIEPLGFSVSALRTKWEALAGISQCDYGEDRPSEKHRVSLFVNSVLIPNAGMRSPGRFRSGGSLLMARFLSSRFIATPVPTLSIQVLLNDAPVGCNLIR